MKIAILTVIISRKSGARAPLEIAKALNTQGSEVTIFGYHFGLESEAVEELREAGVKIELIKANKLLTPLYLLWKLRKGKFDVINFHGTLPFFLAAYFSGIPIVRTYHGSQLDPLLDKVFPGKPNRFLKLANRIVNKIMILQEKFVLSHSDKVLAISYYTQDELKRLYRIPSEVIYEGASSASFKPSPKKVKNMVSVLSVSRIVPYKGFHHLIKVLGKLSEKFPNIKLTIIGSSPDQKYLTYLKKIAGKNVVIKTEVSDQELIQAYQGSDIYATFDRYLFFGMPVLEAASCALPTVAINHCAAPEIIRHGKTGYLAKDEAEFSHHLEELIKNSSLRKRLGSEAQKKSLLFSWDKLAQKYLKVFKTVKKSQGLETGWILAGVLLLGLILRLAFLNKHTFWFDEAFSYFLARLPLPSLLKATSADNNPVFYYLLLKLWLGISQKVEFLRLLSLIFGVASLPLIYKIGQKITNSKVALLATTILAVSPLHIYFSTETRMYSLLVFESLLLTFLFLKFLNEQKVIYLILIALVGTLSLHTHYYSFFILLTFNLIFLVKIKKFKNLFLPWIFAQFVIAVTFIPWFILVIRNPSPGCWCFSPPIGLPAMFVSFAIGGMGVTTLKDFFSYGPRLSFFFFSLAALFTFLAFLRGLWELKKNVSKNAALFFLFFTPLLAVTSLAFFRPLFSPRSLIIISPFYYLLVVFGLLSIKNKLARNLSTGVLVTLISVTLYFQYSHPLLYGPPLEKAADFVAKKHQDNEAILHTSVMTFYSFQYFHRFSYPEFLTIPSDLSQGTIFEIGGHKKTIEEIAPKYSKVWLINAFYWVSPGDVEKVKKILNENFALDLQNKYNQVEIYHFSRR